MPLRIAFSLCFAACAGFAAEPVPEKAPFVDSLTILKFERMGAKFGGMKPDPMNSYGIFTPGPQAVVVGAIPAFQFQKFPEDKLPAMNCPFGIDFYLADLTGAPLKDLEQCKNLTAISLRFATTTPGELSEFKGQ